MSQGNEPEQASVDAWFEARRRGDDESALGVGLALEPSSVCPLWIALCLPGCWQRARGLSEHGALIDRLMEPRPGLARALLAVAAGRLHPAALAHAPSLDPSMLLFAASLGALAQGRAAQARSWLPLCVTTGLVRGLWETAIRVEMIQANRPAAGDEGRVPEPMAPPSAALAASAARAMRERADALARRARLVDALGAAELGRSFVPPSEPLSVGLRVRVGAWSALLGLGSRAEQALGDGEVAPAEGLGWLRRSQARLLLTQDQPERAEELLRGALSRLESALGEEHAEVAEVRSALGTTLAAQGRWDEADALQVRALSALRSAGDGPSEGAAACLHWLGLGRGPRGDLAGAEELLRRALAEREASLAPDHPDRAESLVALGTVLHRQGRDGEALGCYREATSALERSVGALDDRLLLSASYQAALLLDAGRGAEAEPLIRHLLACARGSPEGPDGPEARRWAEALARVAAGAEPSPTDEAVRQAMAGHARGQAPADRLLRAVAEHRRWLLSADGDALRLFSSPEAERLARERGLLEGPLGEARSGREVLDRLEEGLASLELNPGSPEACALGPELLALARSWAATARLEEALCRADAPGDPLLLDSILAAPACTVLRSRTTRGLLTLRDHAGLASGAAVFSAPDLARAFLDQAPAELRSDFQPLPLDGHSLFWLLSRQQVDGLVFNCAGPCPRVLPRALWAASEDG